MLNPPAYLLTWTTHGTWLHGDPRGSVDRHNACVGMNYHPHVAAWRRTSRNRMTSGPVYLDEAKRRMVERTILDHCRVRDWQLVELNCRTNHVHVIVRTDGTPPERVMGEMKAYSTRALREAGHFAGTPVWTRGGSTRYLNTEGSLMSAAQYVRHQ